jgi:hypothetical protein
MRRNRTKVRAAWRERVWAAPAESNPNWDRPGTPRNPAYAVRRRPVAMSRTWP